MVNLSENREVDLKKSDLNAPGKFFLGVDYDIYKAYISSEQLQKIDTDSKKKILEKLGGSDIDYNFSIKNSLEILDTRLKDIGTERAYTKPFFKTRQKIENLKENLSEIDRLKKDFYKSFKKLEDLKAKLEKKEKDYQKKKKINQFYNQKRSDENFKSYRKWSDKLFDINKELEAYRDLEGLNLEDYSDENKDKIDYKIIYIL